MYIMSSCKKKAAKLGFEFWVERVRRERVEDIKHSGGV
jgi:hypothetical protein